MMTAASLQARMRDELRAILRERIVAGDLGGGERLEEVELATELGVTEGTVKVYLHSIFDKTGVANRTELAMRADALIGPEIR